MNIIIFTHNYPISVYERRNAGIFVHDFATELARTNSITVVCPASFDKKVKFGSVTVYFFSWRGGKHLGKLRFWNPFDLSYGLNLFLRGSKILSQVAREIKPDFSLAMWAIPGGIFAYIAKIKFDIPYAVWVLGSDFYVYSKIPILGLFITYVLKNAKYTFADGISLAAEVNKVTGNKCFFLPSSTNFDLHLSKRKTRSYKDKIVLTFVGRMEEIKGPDLLLDAILELRGKAKDYKVNFIGDGSLLLVLKRKAKEGGIKDYIKFYGNLDEKDKIISVLGSSDWLIIPSRSDSIPLVFSEAMKVGIPVIAADLPDLKYLIDKYKVGLYFKSKRSDELSSIIGKLRDYESLRRGFQRNTLAARQIFSLQNSAGTFLKMIEG